MRQFYNDNTMALGRTAETVSGPAETTEQAVVVIEQVAAATPSKNHQ